MHPGSLDFRLGDDSERPLNALANATSDAKVFILDDSANGLVVNSERLLLRSVHGHETADNDLTDVGVSKR